MRLLKQSTEATVAIGPFVDKTDGVTEEAGLAGNGTEIRKAGGSFDTGPVLGAHDAEGYYPITLTAGNTDTLGPLRLKSHDSATHLPVWEDFLVVPANVYDSLVSGTDALDVTTTDGVRKNAELAGFTFFMRDATDHVSGKTGLTVTATRSIDGAAFAACANAVTEIANGWYKITLAATDLNGDVIGLYFTATGADPEGFSLVTNA